MDQKILEIVVCPVCQGKLTYLADSKELMCHLDGLAYPIRDDIPVMLVDDARQILQEKEV